MNGSNLDLGLDSSITTIRMFCGKLVFSLKFWRPPFVYYPLHSHPRHSNHFSLSVAFLRVEFLQVVCEHSAWDSDRKARTSSDVQVSTS